jgi:hypothetical protein
MARGLRAKPPAGRVRVSSVGGLAWARIDPSLFILFPFLFTARLGNV